MQSGASTRNRLDKIRFRLTAAAILCALLSLSPAAANAKNYNYTNKEINQQDSYGYGSNNYWNGSGDSKDEGVRNGMRALNRLAALDIGGAIHYGYKGYGNYTNSQKMDDLDSRAWKLKNVMSSQGDSIVSGTTDNATNNNGGDIQSQLGPEHEGARLPSSGRRGIGGSSSNSESAITSKKFSDMDKGFLYRGETGDVAAEFEKKSGMSRDVFFDHLASAADAGLSWDDPNLMDKFESSYKAFVAAVPNQEYKANLEKVHSMFSLQKKQEVMAEMKEFYIKNRYDGAAPPAAAAKSDVNGSQGQISQGGGGSGGSGSDSGDRAPASVDAGPVAVAKAEEKDAKLTKEQMGMYLGLEGSHGDELKDFMSTLAAADGESIFKVVSRRYRKLTPSLIGKAL